MALVSFSQSQVRIQLISMSKKIEKNPKTLRVKSEENNRQTSEYNWKIERLMQDKPR